MCLFKRSRLYASVHKRQDNPLQADQTMPKHLIQQECLL